MVALEQFSTERGVRKSVVDELNKEKLQQEERREHDRSRLIVDVYFNGADATGVASTKDISLGGLYMNTQTHLPEGAVLMLRIPLGGDQQVIVNAEVIYSNPGHGVGVRFQGLSESDRALMERYLPRP
jgi:PilZ domain